MDEIRAKLKTLPDSPGVYIMKDASGGVIYVGKAVSLKNRVRQYFGSTKKETKVAAMVSQVADFDYVITDSEKQALLLECNLIKRYMPHYNILLKDDKHYPYVRIDTREDFPRVEVVRKVENDGASYFGPYTSALVIREVMDLLNNSFMLRHCKKDIARTLERGERPCLNFAVKKCSAPCAGNISKEEYAANVADVIEFLSGREKTLLKKLKEDMELLSESMEYEKCAILRDRIAGIQQMMERARVATTTLKNLDVFSLATEDGEAALQVFVIRGGNMLQTDSFSLTFTEETAASLMAHTLLTYYSSSSDIPKEILVDSPVEGLKLVEELLADERGGKVEIRQPLKGEGKRLVEMAKKNAEETLFRKINHREREYERTVGAAKRLKNYLRLTCELERIECYDISNIQGTDSVASMVVFTSGKPDYKEYRHFKIKTVEGANDFASMNEVIERRFLRYLKERDEKFSTLPDLIVIDGGKGQLSSAYDALASVGLESIPMIGLAKRMEEIFLPFESEPIVIDKDDAALKLLQRVRDEAHRFAITYHRSLREKGIKAKTLLKIDGIGEKRATALLRAFKSIAGIQNAALWEIEAVPGMDRVSAKRVHDHFNL